MAEPNKDQMDKVVRNKDGTFRRWKGGRHEPGSHQKFQRRLTRQANRAGTPTRTRNQFGQEYRRTKSGNWRKLSDIRAARRRRRSWKQRRKDLDRDEKGRFKNWEGGRNERGSWERFRRRLRAKAARKKAKVVKTKQGEIYRRQKSGVWARIRQRRECRQ